MSDWNVNKNLFKKGDIVTVDNRCQAEIVWVGKVFATITVCGESWDIMISRLTTYKKEAQ